MKGLVHDDSTADAGLEQPGSGRTTRHAASMAAATTRYRGALLPREPHESTGGPTASGEAHWFLAVGCRHDRISGRSHDGGIDSQLKYTHTDAGHHRATNQRNGDDDRDRVGRHRKTA